MVPFWVPIINTGPNTGPNLRDPKRDHNFDNPPSDSLLPTSDACELMRDHMQRSALVAAA